MQADGRRGSSRPGMELITFNGSWEGESGKQQSQDRQHTGKHNFDALSMAPARVQGGRSGIGHIRGCEMHDPKLKGSGTNQVVRRLATTLGVTGSDRQKRFRVKGSILLLLLVKSRLDHGEATDSN